MHWHSHSRIRVCKAENDINDSITVINSLLREIDELDSTITESTLLGQDVGDLLDRRDIAVRELAEYMGYRYG